MNTMKKSVSLLLTLLMLFSLFACGEYNPATGKPIGGGGEDDPGQVEQPELNDDPTDDFTVTVTADGAPYVPRMDMYVIWTSDFSVHKAPLGRDGVARIDGLDGDYRVTLSAVPNEYTYNPNVNIATNAKKNITLELKTLNVLMGGGTGFSDCYSFKKEGVYSAQIDSASDAVYFEFAPSMNGTYTIESWTDVEEDNINPYIRTYITNAGGYVSSTYTTYDDGGPSGSYTKNFVYEVSIAEQHISNSGQVTYKFVLKAEAKNNVYPITITFEVDRTSDYELPESSSTEKTVAIPSLDFNSYEVSDHEYSDSEYTMKYPEYPFEGLANTYVFDDRCVKLWKKGDGGDGFYHMYDAEKYADTNGYGPILYANITGTVRSLGIVNGVRFHNSEGYSGNTSSFGETFVLNGVNYTHFIKGYSFLASPSSYYGRSYYCANECKCHKQSDTAWACPESCTSCHRDCKRCPEALIGNEGYQSIANSDGMVAVTEELKIFLEQFVKSQSYFLDGKGTIDGYDGYQAVSDSGWLFACAYYEKN